MNRVLLFGLVAGCGLLQSQNVYATPAFAAQINAGCQICHFADMHSLNKFGKRFKQQGFKITEDMQTWIDQDKRKRETHHDFPEASLP